MEKFTNKRGDTLVEVLIAFMILGLTLTSVVYLLSSIKSMSDETKNRTIAINLAREGMEGVRNLRDTNWMRFSGERREKWNHPNCESDDNTCKDDENIENNTCYTVDINSDNRWSLGNKSGSDMNGSSRKLYLDTSSNLYTHDSSGASKKETSFKREVCFKYLKNDGSEEADPTKDSEDNILRVTVTVDWTHLSGNQKPIKLVSELTDFLGRANKDE